MRIDPADLLRERGLRVTAQRLAVLRAVSSESHVTADAVARVGDNHHPVICRFCGRMADVDCAVGSAPCLTAVDDIGYQIDEAEVIYWGRCPEYATSVPSDG